MPLARMRRTIPGLIAVLLVALLAAPSAAFAAAPVTELFLDPATPDGNDPWWLTPADVYARSDQDVTLHWAWNGGIEITATLVGGAGPVLFDFMPEGLSTITAYSVNSLGETGAPAVAPVTAPWPWHVDSIDPPVPADVTVTPSAGALVVKWGAVTDGGSGMHHYNIYRNTSGPPFFQSQKVGQVLVSAATTQFPDTALPPVDYVHYGVSAADVAGNESAIATDVLASTDVVPPTDPSNLQAWLNASSWCRVSWTGSVDLGTGMSHYLVYRRFEGGPWQLAATVGGGATTYDDHDPAVPFAGMVEYYVVAVDRAGSVSGPAGPALMLSDVTPPTPTPPTAAPVYTGAYGSARFDVSWAPVDTGSGVAAVTLMHGPVSGAPSVVQAVSGTSLRVDTGTAPALWYFQLRAEDRAGNLSPVSAPSAARYVPTGRLSGAGRVQTSLALSKAAFPTASTVVIASALDFPDALSASALAGAVRGPVILVSRGPLPAETAAELLRLNASNAYIVGGASAVRADTFASIDAALSGTVTRVAGPSRYDTAARVASRVKALAGTSFSPKAFIVSGETFPDALSAAPAAYAARRPILFATSSGVPAATRAALSSLGVNETLIVGGAGAVWSGTEGVAPGASRVSGSDRYDTSRKFGEWAEGKGLLSRAAPVIATGQLYPDGLSAAPLAGERASLLLLTSETDAATGAAWLGTARASMSRQTVVGGTAALSDTVQRAFWSASSLP